MTQKTTWYKEAVFMELNVRAYKDSDGDGWATCDASGASLDCCDAHECGTPAAVNPGAYDMAVDSVDNDCDGMIDNELGFCDQGLASASTMATDSSSLMSSSMTT